MSTKQSNPKESLGIRKVPMHVVPTKPLMALGLAMMEGGRKYGAHNYRKMGVRFSTYYDAAMRHLMSWWEGEDIDPDSGVYHVIKAMACLTVLMDSIYMGNAQDDRPIKYPDGIDMESFNKTAAEIIEKYPKEVPPFLEVGNVKIDLNPDAKLYEGMAKDRDVKKLKEGDKVLVKFNNDGHGGPLVSQSKRTEPCVATIISRDTGDGGYYTDIMFIYDNEIIEVLN